MYDNICKFLAEQFSRDFASWLVGEPLEFTQLSPKELSLEPIRADSLILLQSDPLILHLEFQTEPNREIPFRMADYRLRVYRRFPEKSMRQVVIYLRETTSELVYENRFTLAKTYHEFEVIRLWEEPTEPFLNAPGLWPLAALTGRENPTEVLTQVAQRLEGMENRTQQANITAASAILAGLVLNQQLIQRILRRDIMRESSMYQEILAEGRQEGRQEGIEEVALNLVRSGMSLEQIAGVTGLSVQRVRELSEEHSE